MTRVLVAQGGAFKRCCMLESDYDGERRNYYRRDSANTEPRSERHIPTTKPSTHNGASALPHNAVGQRVPIGKCDVVVSVVGLSGPERGTGADHRVAGDERRQLVGRPALGALRPHRQHHEPLLRRRVNDAYLDIVAELHPELREHGARLAHDAAAVLERLVPGGRVAEHRPWVAGAQCADDHVVDVRRVLHPGAGKTTVAAALRERFGLPVIAKDELKEALGGALGTTGRESSMQLGSAVFEAMRVVVYELLSNGVSLIAEGNFTTRSSLFDALPPARVVQVHVSAALAVLRARLATRDTHEHPVHWDREAADEIETRAASGEWDPLQLRGALVQLETTVWPDLEPLLAELDRVVATIR